MGAFAAMGPAVPGHAQPAASIDPAQPFSRPPSDLNLVLAVDCSRSIDDDEYRLQAQGYASAFGNERVRRAILAGHERRIAVTLTHWGGQRVQHQAIGWTLLDSPAAIGAFAKRLAAQPRLTDDDATAIGAAIDHARGLFGQCPFASLRRVIDVSGDGSNNQGRLARYARDEAVAAGIGINGLPILTDEPNLDSVYRQEVIGGPGAFVVPIRRFADFAAAIAHKLFREIA
ncbi:MAG: DUF1194 domain-containing protein [Proteobacteria bacterium]|nr:DUF1194 domain-containing protein [Pseudomonadota bacterium]